MKIDINSIPQETYISRLKVGDLFEYSGRYYNE